MNFTTMDGQLGRRLADEKSSKFNELARIDAVNNAMLRISNLLDNDMLEELRTTQTVAPTTGSYALVGLTTAIVRNGVELVYDVTNSKWLHLVDSRDIGKENNRNCCHNACKAVCRQFKEININCICRWREKEYYCNDKHQTRGFQYRRKIIEISRFPDTKVIDKCHSLGLKVISQ